MTMWKGRSKQMTTSVTFDLLKHDVVNLMQHIFDTYHEYVVPRSIPITVPISFFSSAKTKWPKNSRNNHFSVITLRTASEIEKSIKGIETYMSILECLNRVFIFLFLLFAIWNKVMLHSKLYQWKRRKKHVTFLVTRSWISVREERWKIRDKKRNNGSSRIFLFWNVLEQSSNVKLRSSVTF